MFKTADLKKVLEINSSKGLIENLISNGVNPLDFAEALDTINSILISEQIDKLKPQNGGSKNTKIKMSGGGKKALVIGLTVCSALFTVGLLAYAVAVPGSDAVCSIAGQKLVAGISQAAAAASTSHPITEFVIGKGLSTAVSSLIGGPIGTVASSVAGSAGTGLTSALYAEAGLVSATLGQITPAAAAVAATTCHQAQVLVNTIFGLEMVLGASGAYCANGLITDSVKEKQGNSETKREFIVDTKKLMTDERIDLLEAKKRGEAHTATFVIKGVETVESESEVKNGGGASSSIDKKNNISKALSMTGFSTGTINRVIDLQESKQHGSGRLTRRRK